MLTPETVVNITSVLTGLLITTAVLLEPFGTRAVYTVTGLIMWIAVQVDLNNNRILLIKYNKEEVEEGRAQQRPQPPYLSPRPLWQPPRPQQRPPTRPRQAVQPELCVTESPKNPSPRK